MENLQQEQVGCAAQTPEGDLTPAPEPYKAFLTKEQYQQDFDEKMGQRLNKMRTMSEQLSQLSEHFGVDSVDELLSTPSPYLVDKVTNALSEPVSQIKKDLPGMEIKGEHDLAADPEFVSLLAQGLAPTAAYLALYGLDLVKNATQNSRPVEGAISDIFDGQFACANAQDFDQETVQKICAAVKMGKRIAL